jgi:hypothetical protein
LLTLLRDDREDEVLFTISPAIANNASLQDGEEEEVLANEVVEGPFTYQAEGTCWAKRRIPGALRLGRDQPSNGMVHSLHAADPWHES